MLLLLCLLLLSKHHIRGYQTLSKEYNFIKLRDFNFKLHDEDSRNLKVNSKSTKNEIDFNLLANLHKNAFEHPEFQLHIPPTSNAFPKLNKHLSNPTLLSSSSSNIDTTSTANSNNSQSNNNYKDKEEEEELDDYLDGPLDVLEMLKKGQIPEYRHLITQVTNNSTNSDIINSNNNLLTNNNYKDNNYKEDKKDKDRPMFSCWWERPCDVFVLNYALIDMNVREYLYLSVKVIEKTELFADLHKRVKELLNSISKEHFIPNWLLTLFRYSAPLANSFSDFVYLTYFLATKYLETDSGHLDNSNSNSQQTNSKNKSLENDSLEKLRPLIRNWNPLELVDYLSQELYRPNFDFLQLFNWKSNGIYSELSKLFVNINLNQLFARERVKLRRDRRLSHDLLKFRNNANSHVSYNVSLVQLLNYFLNYFKMPIYLITDFEGVREVRHRLSLFGVKPNNLLTVLSCNNPNSVNNNPNKHNVNNNNNNVGPVLDNLLRGLNLDERIPVHYFDNSLSNFYSLLSNDKLKNVRLHFADWGRSTYDDKLKALYHPKLKYVKNNKSLIEFLCKFNVSESREFSHGFRLRNPFEEQFTYISNWKSYHSSS